MRLHGPNNQVGTFVARSEDVAGLSPVELQAKFSLKYEPTKISDLTIPAGTPMRTGQVASNFKGQEGVRQFEILLPKEEINQDWFSKARLLKK